ncbi:cholinephosphotransferase 1 [Tetranychus urticae]|uniref:cholinephosphotransferase 1 n=1 Tax=Tetranychus urticae TaxID=32264 RepID=UPI00077B9391|nr:cholinephosphotransferase 1 [Tetranychus urticae]
MLLCGGDVLTERQLHRLNEHKYRSAGNTLLDPVMQKFWNWFTKRLPLWLAPNLMTLVGLCVNALTTVVLILYSPDGKQPIPGWALIFFAIGLFIYQTLDATDGKQARRTGTSSPLGELFDHGCDSISTVLASIATCLTFQLGYYPGWMFYQCIAASFLFYLAHWQTYVSATLKFGRFDVTEVQFSIMFFNILTACTSQDFWASTVPGLNMELKILPAIAIAIAHAIVAFNNFSVILAGGVGKNGSTVAGTSVLSPCIPIAIVIVPAFIIYQKSSPHLFEEHPCLYLITFGLIIAKVTNRLVVAHMTKSEMDYLDTVLIGPAMLFLNQYFNNFLPEYFVLWLALIYTLADLIHYAVVICRQISSYLHINVLTIAPNSPSWNAQKSDKHNKGSLNEQSSGDSASVLIPLFENYLVEDEDDDDNVIIDQDKRVGEQDDDDLNAPNERSNQLYP